MMRAPLVLHGPLDSAKPAGGNIQFGFVDLLKAVAAQLIVLHHLAFYGPMSDYVQPVMPGLIGWLSAHARIAVQVFLVVGGFLAARSLTAQVEAGRLSVSGMVLRRYLKLAPPFMAATGIAVGVSACVSQWMTHDSISPPPGFLQLAAHAFFLHGILDYESLWAGAWYVAIDFQLFVALTWLFWLSAGLSGLSRSLARPWLMPAMVVACMGASLLYFNRIASWDVWGVYFFGSYGLGVLAWWASDAARRPAVRALLLATILMMGVVALAIDFRSRIAVALCIACALVFAGRRCLWNGGFLSSAVGRLGRESYSIFLVHFPVCLLVNALFINFAPAEPLFQGLGMLAAWGACLAAGSAFHRWVEAPLNRMSASGAFKRGRLPGRAAGNVLAYARAKGRAAFGDSRFIDAPSRPLGGTFQAPDISSNEEAYRYRYASRKGRAGG